MLFLVFLIFLLDWRSSINMVLIRCYSRIFLYEENRPAYKLD